MKSISSVQDDPFGVSLPENVLGDSRSGSRSPKTFSGRLYLTRIVVFFWGVLVTVTSSSAQEISGRIFMDLYLPAGGPEKSWVDTSFQQASASVWFQLDPKLSEDTQGHLVLTGDQFQASSVVGNSNSGFRLGLREGFVDYAKSGWNFRAGKMILPWGKSDVVNPTDFLTAKDMTFFNPDEEVRRIGAVSWMLSWTPRQGSSPWTLSWVMTPVFPQSNFLLAPGQLSSQVTLSSNSLLPVSSLANAENAFKVAYAGVGWDASFLFFRGWNHTPLFQATQVTVGASGPLIEVSRAFQRYRALGMDTSFNWGNWVLRAESAYVWTDNDDGQNPLLQPSHWDLVAGFERPLWEDFRIQTQFLMRYFPRYFSPSLLTSPVDREVALANALVHNYQDQTRPSATLRISYANEANHLSSDLFILGNFVGGGYLFRPQVHYAWTDSLKVTLGWDYSGGPSDRPLGVLATYNALFTEVKYVF